ncbi:MAG: preprotein translocase subunit YajC [Candidatus Moduliflexus flocculans]|nr:preprotein translocase subunit YajC [Candidatus Moduliflexus flocculans]
MFSISSSSCPSRRRPRNMKLMLESIDKGDDVITSGGIHGKVVGITDNVLTLDVGDKVKIKVSREFIAHKKSVDATQK